MSALVVNRLTKSFGGLRVTRGVNLDVGAGERRLIIGPNGAGKTTLFNLITGELTPDAGSVALFGNDITRVPSRRRPHMGMARTYQIITLFPNDTIIHNVSLALLQRSFPDAPGFRVIELCTEPEKREDGQVERRGDGQVDRRAGPQAGRRSAEP